MHVRRSGAAGWLDEKGTVGWHAWVDVRPGDRVPDKRKSFARAGYDGDDVDDAFILRIPQDPMKFKDGRYQNARELIVRFADERIWNMCIAFRKWPDKKCADKLRLQVSRPPLMVPEQSVYLVEHMPQEKAGDAR